MRLPNGYGTVYKLSGNRRKPYIVRTTIGWELNQDTGKTKQQVVTIGYAKTKAEGLQMLAEYNQHPFDIASKKVTFGEVYERWSNDKFQTTSQASITSYKAAYQAINQLAKKPIADLKLRDLEKALEDSGKNYPTLRKIKVLLQQVYDYAMRHDLVLKDYASLLDITKYKDKNPNKTTRTRFSSEEIEILWEHCADPYIQIVLMLIYNGVRISEFLELEKKDVDLEQKVFDVKASKTVTGIRKVPIAEKVLPFYKEWFYSSDCEYLLHTPEGQPLEYRNFYDAYFTPTVKNLGMDHKPHDTRHTCSSLLQEVDDPPINQTVIDKILGHSGAGASIGQKVYTHLDIETLLRAINRI